MSCVGKRTLRKPQRQHFVSRKQCLHSLQKFSTGARENKREFKLSTVSEPRTRKAGSPANMRFTIILILLSASLLTTVSADTHAPIYLYRNCQNSCRKRFTICMRGCSESKVKQCIKKLKKCNVGCDRKYKALTGSDELPPAHQ